MNTIEFFADTKAVEAFCKQYDIAYLAVFGSCARGQEKPDSDIDVLVEFKQPVTYFDLLTAEQELSRKVKKKVDLVTKRAISSRIRPYIEHDLIAFYEKS